MPERHPAGAPPRCETVPAPVVTGPVPYETPGGGGRDYPFLLTDVDLDSRGYVAGEFFYLGRANSYDAPVPTVNNDPAPPIAGVKSSGHPYTTRLMVYGRPNRRGSRAWCSPNGQTPAQTSTTRCGGSATTTSATQPAY